MHTKGLTLLELLLVLAIASILSLAALPPIHRTIGALRASDTAYAFFEAVQLARSTAVSRNRQVVLAPLGSWSNGWEVFVDQDADGGISADEDVLTRVHASAGVQVKMAATSNSAIVYRGTGASHTINGAFLAGTIRICAESGDAPGKAIVIRSGGRARMDNLTIEECAAL